MYCIAPKEIRSDLLGAALTSSFNQLQNSNFPPNCHTSLRDKAIL